MTLDPAERLVRDLLALGAEHRNLDFKGPFAWDGSSRERAELIRDLMCFSNTPDGGYILVGVQETPTGFRPVGLSESQAATFDPTAIADLARSYCSVLPNIRVTRVSVDACLLVLITVNEFDSAPIVCTRDQGDGRGGHVLRAGSLYTRTTGASCEPIRGAEEMSRLLDMALRKRGEALLSQIRSIVGSPATREGHPDGTVSPATLQVAEGESFFQDRGLEGPHWQVAIYPSAFQSERMDRRRLINTLESTTVAIRGWDFPHVDTDTIESFESGIRSKTDWRAYQEGFVTFRSGVFLWRRLLREDLDGTPGTLWFINAIWSLTEFFSFAARYTAALLDEGDARIEITATGLEGRTLESDYPGVHLSMIYRAAVDLFRHTGEISVGELTGAHDELARSAAKELFELFNWFESAGAIDQWQSRFLNREF